MKRPEHSALLSDILSSNARDIRKFMRSTEGAGFAAGSDYRLRRSGTETPPKPDRKNPFVREEARQMSPVCRGRGD